MVRRQRRVLGDRARLRPRIHHRSCGLYPASGLRLPQPTPARVACAWSSAPPIHYCGLPWGGTPPPRRPMQAARTRAPYPLEFRQQMVELVRTGRTPEEPAGEFEPSARASPNTLDQAERDAGRRTSTLRQAFDQIAQCQPAGLRAGSPRTPDSVRYDCRVPVRR